jgi:ribosome biogenesis GTPase A
MSGQSVLSVELKRQYESLRGALQRCLSLTDKCAESDATAILRERLTHLESAALFVIVGEVKAGKSSFVNALLGEDVCEVAPDPCTAGIQELVYGEERSKMILGDHWERVRLPKPVLREITIVDTPGTNSIIRNHQTITENYIPQSDLVVFVFPAKNPHTATAWDLLGLIRKEWHRKTVFVLQQADLATQRELSTNQERVKQYAHERNVQAPIVFALSAKRETEGASDSGFAEFREYLRNAVDSGEVWRMKVEGGRDTLRRIISNLLAKLRKADALLAEDKAFYQNLLARVESRRQKAHSLRRLVIDSLCVSYDRLSGRLEEDFKNGLGVGTILRRSLPLIRDKDVKTWLKDLHAQFERAAREEIEAESLRVSKDLSAEMTAMLDELTQAVTTRQAGQQQVSIPQVADRTDILEQLSRQLRDLRVSDIVADKGVQGSDLGKLTLTGGGLAALGAVIALATHLIVFDITGGILAVIGAGLVAVTLLWKRSSIVRDFSLKLVQSRQDFRNRLDQEISGMFDRLFLELEHYLKEPLERLEKETVRIAPLIAEAVEVNEATETLC